MAKDASYEKDDYLDDDQDLDNQDQNENKKVVGAASWILSGLIHLILIAALTLLAITNPVKPKDKIIVTSLLETPVEKPDIEKVIEVVKKPTEVKVKIEVVLPPMVSTEEPVDHSETENDSDEQQAEGDQKSISDLPQVGAGDLSNLGGGGGGGGSFGLRTKGGRRKAVMINGGSPATESAVDWALIWLATHQEDDGHWDTAKWEGAGTPESDVASSGAALLAFLGAGHTDRVGDYKTHVRKGLEWLLKAQKPDGSFDRRNYANGICTMAIAEAAGMNCGGSELKNAVSKAVDYLLKEQNPSGGFFYEGPVGGAEPNSQDDMSVTGWCIMGLKSSMLANIKEAEIKNAFKKCGDLLDKAWHTSDNSSTSKGLAWYRATEHQGSGAKGGACQAIAMLVRQYLGWQRDQPWLHAAAEGQISKIPQNYESMDVYRTYYAYLTLFQQGGAPWKAWNKPVSDIIVKAQRLDGDFRGSWNPNGSHMEKGGRVLFTAFLCLSLEVYYRYLYIMESK